MERIGHCQTTAIGSMPHKDPEEALALIIKYLDIPAWPQLPQRTPLEGMLEQFADGMPDNPEISVERASGLYAFLTSDNLDEKVAIKGQITGPVTLGKYLDLTPRQIEEGVYRKARWQETKLKEVHNQILLFVDEPVLRKQSPGLSYVLEGAHKDGYAGVHSCGRLDPRIIYKSGAQIISMDTYGHPTMLGSQWRDTAQFLDDGGLIAWGAVPTQGILQVSEEDIMDRFRFSLDSLVRQGMSEDFILKRSLITPSCGAGNLNEDECERLYQLTQNLSHTLRGERQ